MGNSVATAAPFPGEAVNRFIHSRPPVELGFRKRIPCKCGKLFEQTVTSVATFTPYCGDCRRKMLDTRGGF